MATQDSFFDWLELLGLKAVFDGLVAGRTTAADADDAVEAARDQYPGISQDYIAMLDQARAFIAEMRTVMRAEEDEIRQFNDDAASDDYYFVYTPGRLLTEDERAWFEELQQRLQADLQQHQATLQQLGRKAGRLNNEIERLAQDAEDEIEDALDKLKTVEENLEDAQDDLETVAEESNKSKPKAPK